MDVGWCWCASHALPSQLAIKKSQLQAIENLLPTAPEYRTWNWSDYFFLWMNMSFSVNMYMIGSSLIASGLTWWQSVLCILVSHVCAVIPVILAAHVGTKWGIAFPYWCRISFGTRAARIITLLRGLVACTLMGQQMWLATNSVYLACAALLPGLLNSPQIGSFGTDVGRFFMYIAVACTLVGSRLEEWKSESGVLTLVAVVSCCVLCVGCSYAYGDGVRRYRLDSTYAKGDRTTRIIIRIFYLLLFWESGGRSGDVWGDCIG